jgi:DNA-directed RNA polymerase II subunit RPB2
MNKNQSNELDELNELFGKKLSLGENAFELSEDKNKDESSCDFNTETPWTIINSYFRSIHLERLVRHQLESYNNFVQYQIFKTIEMFNPVHVVSEQDYDKKTEKYALEIFMNFENFQLQRPKIYENNGATKLMFPQEARLRNFTYASEMNVDVNIKYVVRNGENMEFTQTFYKILPKIQMGKLPIMLKSCICLLNQYKHVKNNGECEFDTGGYFIVNGSEKTVLGQERAAENKIYCFNISKNNTKYTWMAEIKCVPDLKCLSPKQINMMISSKNNGFGHPIYIQIPRIKQPIPLFTMFRALGIASDKKICEIILLNTQENERQKTMLEALKASIIDANKYNIVKYIPKKEIEEKIHNEYSSFILLNVEEKSILKLIDPLYETFKNMNDEEITLKVEYEIIKHADKIADLYNEINKSRQEEGEKKGEKEGEKDEIYKKTEKIQYEIEKETNKHDEYVKYKEYGKYKKFEKKCNNTDNKLNEETLTEIVELEYKNHQDAYQKQTKEEAIKYLISYAMYTSLNFDKEIAAKKKYEFTLDVINNDLFPQCNNEIQKTYFLGVMTHKLLYAHFDWIKADDRDSYLNKRIDCAGTLLNNLFRNYFNRLVKDINIQTIREINTGSWKSKNDYDNIINERNIYKIIKTTTIENGIKRALSTGDFGVSQMNSNKVGVAQVLNRLTYVSALSHERRISTPTDKSGKLIPPRKLHNTSWGFLCPAETPEGQSVGIVKNLSYMTHITIHSNVVPLYDYILPNIRTIETLRPDEMYERVKVFINGVWIGISDNPYELYCSLKEKKYKGIINIYTSIVFDYKLKELRICNEAGRLMRPLFIVKNNKILLTNQIINRLKCEEITWDDLFTDTNTGHAVLEYIDAEEQNTSLIATTINDLLAQTTIEFNDANKIYKYTHCEIHPSTLFGIMASCIPFPEHNQSPRNCYQCAQGKQAMGIYSTNFDIRMDKTAYILNYPTRPLVDTRIMNIIQLHKIPSGTNIIVAIMTHTGYNQEDSLLINKGSLDRGLFLATIYHTEKDEDKKKINGDKEIRCRPDANKTKGMKIANYEKVNSKGVIPENTLVKNRDIIMGKVGIIKENRNDPTKTIKFEDQSKMFRTSEETFVDKNYINKNGEGYNFAKVRLRNVRKPVIGDKFSSRMGQKGTIGNIIPEEDMPFTKDGIKPDLIINPHAIPSRMTIGQLKEMLLAKVLISLGLFGDGTPYGELSVENICSELLNVGYEQHGNELLYNGLTGEQVECSVFMGPVFYQRLKHMVNDKVHSRSFGPMVNLTRQPAEGRARDGGLRFGEMEKDAMVSHGASKFTRERMYMVSDKYNVYSCKKCGLIAMYNHEMKIHYCKTCENRSDFAYIELPYSCKLLFQELTTMNVVPRIMTE